ncbi:hypothetical protein BD626DRAFT_36764 [Schizophyllum amplum]|uniref:Secreted protein n=1 Tax=Schizophyllum amplum TaxID=97359 RepID=A0A550CF77_9AGAR|nr:hypothetical protein BD626DRAFT_36764 [Auriculariopsis ampla]
MRRTSVPQAFMSPLLAFVSPASCVSSVLLAKPFTPLSKPRHPVPSPSLHSKPSQPTSCAHRIPPHVGNAVHNAQFRHAQRPVPLSMHQRPVPLCTSAPPPAPIPDTTRPHLTLIAKA